MSKLKLQSLLIAFGTYFFILLAIIIALYQHKEPIKAKQYTAKKSEVIEVSLGNSTPIKTKSTSKKKSIKKPRKKIQKKKKKKIVKKVRNNKKSYTKKKPKRVKKPTKRPIKKQTKKASVKKPTSKKVDTNNLFNSISKITKNNSKAPPSKSGKNGKSQKKVDKNKGIENRYFAKIQNTLKGWPAQSNFAGEKIRVQLTVYQSGLFDYKILYKSLNPEFNEALRNYLEQLKRVGFGMHSNPTPYKIIVEFIAK